MLNASRPLGHTVHQYLVPSELERLVAVVGEGAAGRGCTELQVAGQS